MSDVVFYTSTTFVSYMAKFTPRPMEWAHTVVERKWLPLRYLNGTAGSNETTIYISFSEHLDVLKEIIGDVSDYAPRSASVECNTELALHPTSIQAALVLDAILKKHLNCPWAPDGLFMAALTMCDMVSNLGESGRPSEGDLLEDVNMLYGISISKEEYDILMLGYCDTKPRSNIEMVYKLTELLFRYQCVS